MSQLSKFSGAGIVVWTALVAAAWSQQPIPSAISSPLEASQSFIETALAAAKEAVANGRYEESLRHSEDATNAARRLGDDGLLANSLGQQGVAYLLLARYPEATKVLAESLSYDQSVAIDQRLNDLTNLGVAYHYMGAYAEAVQTYETTLALAREHSGEPNVRRREQIAAINLATLYQRLGMQQRALNLYRKLAVDKGALRPSEQARMLSNMGALYRRLGDPVKALEAYSQARALYRQQRDPRGELNTALNTAIARAFGLGRADAASELREVVAKAEAQGDRNQSVKARLYLGELALRQEPKQARAVYREVLDQARSAGLAEEQWRAEYGLARAAAEDSASEAIRYLETAVLTIESVRSRIAAPSLSSEYLADRDAVYDRLIELRLAECCTASSGPDNEQISQLLGLIGRQQARSFDDRLNATLSRSALTGDPESLQRLRRLREQISEAAASSSTGVAELEAQFESVEAELFRELPGQTSFTLEHLQQRLGKDEAGWVLWLGDRTGCVIWLTRDGVVLSVLPSSKAIVEQAGLLRSALTRPGASDWTKPAQSLGAALFAVPGSFADVSHLRLMPDASIAGIPLEILPVADGSGEVKQLLDEVTISYHPSLAELAATRTASRRLGGGSSLVVANPASSAASPLPFAVQEGRSAAAAIRGNDLFLEGTAATRAAVIEGITSRPNVIHFAAHAELNEVEPEFSSLVLSGRDSIFLGDVYTWDLSNARLVTLSACDTADGRNTPGEGVAALDRAFLAAGASNVVATLWRVDDQATSLFMERFYKRLGAGKGPAQAMQETKIDFRDSGGPYAHPAYWAAFTLSGEAVSPVVKTYPWRQGLLALALALGAFAAIAGRRKSTAARPR